MQIAKNVQADGAKALAVSAALVDYTVERVIAPVDYIAAAAQAGSSAAFEELHSIYSGRLYKTILSITRNPHDAEEALQDTFLRAYLARHLKVNPKSTHGQLGSPSTLLL